MTTDPSPANGDTQLPHELARGILALGSSQWSNTFTLPYPAPAQRALDRVALAALRRGQTPPLGMPELITRCAQSSSALPLDVPPNLVASEATLVDPETRVPSRTCVELASAARDGGPLREAEAFMSDLAATTTPETFRECRRFLIERVVVTQEDSLARTWKPLIWERVRKLYGGVPPGHAVAGSLAQCPGCGLLAHVVEERVTWCEGATCPRGLTVDRTHDASRVSVLGLGLRMFLCLPGRTEGPVVTWLSARGVTATVEPGTLGTHLLSAPVCGRHTMRVLDWVEPGLLADELAGQSDLLVVIPARVSRSRPGYLRTVRRLLPTRSEVSVVSSSSIRKTGDNA